jgi:hypothetical protein
MGLRHAIDAIHERRHAHGGSPARGKFSSPFERRRDDLMQSVFNVRGFPEKALRILHPLEIRHNHPA